MIAVGGARKITPMTPIDEAIAMWERYRSGVVAELENIPEEQWDFRPGPGARTLREVAEHIGAASVGFTDELLSEEPNFMRPRQPEVLAKLMSPWTAATGKAGIIKLLTTSGTETMQRLRDASSMLASKSMKTMTAEQSRLSGLWFAAAHESYHRGQLTTYARATGHVPAMTQQMQAQQKKS